MVTITFNPNGGPLSASVAFLGNMDALYELSLREKDSNGQRMLLKGDNTNSEDDSIELPSPVSENDGRRVVLYAGFHGEEPDHFPDYEVRLEILQDGNLIGVGSDTGTLSGKGQTAQIFIKLTI